VRAVVARGFERIHRSNLICMGVLPLQFLDGVSWATLGLEGTEHFDLQLGDGVQPRASATLRIQRRNGEPESVPLAVRIDTLIEAAYFSAGPVGQKKSLPGPRPPPSSPGAIVIIGAGAAGAATAARLRSLGCTGSIIVIGNEAPGPVDRPNLSKDYLSGTAPEDWLPLRTRKFYEKIGVDLRIGDAATALDPARRIVTLASGQRSRITLCCLRRARSRCGCLSALPHASLYLAYVGLFARHHSR
jgi:hypothetical protein